MHKMPAVGTDEPSVSTNFKGEAIPDNRKY